jgi:hypothetical protein
MKILLLCNDQGNQRALGHKLHNAVGLNCIIVWKPKFQIRKGGFGLLKLIQKVKNQLLGGYVFRRVWYKVLSKYDSQYPFFPVLPNYYVHDVNCEIVQEYIKREKPNLVIVSGTNLLKANIIKTIQEHGKIMNLHTGLSPYIKGGPNCTNWCLYLREFSLIGNTIMWLDAGIDSGNIITTSRTQLTGRESLLEIHKLVLDHGHQLYVDAVTIYVNGGCLPDVPQNSIAKGRLFLNKNWGSLQTFKALFNFLIFYRPGTKLLDPPPNLKLVVLGNSRTSG